MKINRHIATAVALCIVGLFINVHGQYLKIYNFYYL